MIIRYTAEHQQTENQKQCDERSDSLKVQESEISRLVKLVPDLPCTLFSKVFLSEKSSLVQTHMGRIAEYCISVKVYGKTIMEMIL